MRFSNSNFSSVSIEPHQILLPSERPKPIYSKDRGLSKGVIPVDLPTKERGGNLPNREQESQIHKKQLSIKTLSYLQKIFELSEKL